MAQSWLSFVFLNSLNYPGFWRWVPLAKRKITGGLGPLCRCPALSLPAARGAPTAAPQTPRLRADPNHRRCRTLVRALTNTSDPS